MPEREPNQFEQEPERIPTAEEVQEALREFIGKDFEVKRTLEDEQGLYILEVETPGDAEGEVIEYAYMRKGSYPEGAITATEIHVTYYVDGEAISGTSFAKFVDNKWERA